MTSAHTEEKTMTRKHFTARRLALGLALALGATAVVAAPAQARPDDLDGQLSYATGDVQTLVRPDDRAVRVSPVVEAPAATNLISKLPDDRAEHKLFGGGVDAVTIVSDDGTEIGWRDAGFAALGTMMLIALMGATALAIRQGRQRGRLAAS
jgi:hypothetical protein